MARLNTALCLLAATLFAAGGCGKDPSTPHGDGVDIDPADFVAGVDNPYWPLVPGTTFIYEGDGERIVVEVKGETKTILGVPCMVVRDRVWAEGELVEDTADWYAQHVDGDVWYFGEDSKEIEDGQVVDTEGSWEAGVDGAEPGVLMRGTPEIGEIYQQEYYEDEAEDMAEVLSLSAPATVVFGSYPSCLQTREWTPLEPGVAEEKFYAPGVGLVLEVMVEGGTGRVELVDIVPPPAPLDPGDFTTVIDNPYFPLAPGTTFTFEGESDGESEQIVVEVLAETKLVLGVTCRVVRDRAYVEGELVEDTRDWYAQHANGDLWYFGEDSQEIEGGVVVSTAGSWEAGVDGAQAGILMRATPQVGDSYRQEFFAGEAEDMAAVVGSGETVSVAWGDFTDCLRIREWTPLAPGVAEEKVYAPGVGLVLEVKVAGGTGEIELVDITD
jgi:hypothetical protein